MSAVLVLDLSGVMNGIDMSTWTNGPLPIAQPSNRATRLMDQRRVTDETARRTLISSHQADALYGAGDFRRRHRVTPDADQLIALELMEEAAAAGAADPLTFLAIHLWGPNDAPSHDQQLSWWSQLLRDKNRSGGLWGEVGTILGRPIDRGIRLRHLAFTSADVLEAQALAYAFVGGVSTQVDGDVRARAARHEWTLTKPDWSVLVLRDGASFISHQVSDESFGPSLRTLMHSVHLDALLLALLQRRLIDRSGDRATEVDLDHASDLVELEKSHYDFRRKYWRTSITEKRTAPVDVVLRAFQEEMLTTLDVTDVETRVRDGARLSVSLSAREQEESARQQKVEQERLTGLVQTATAVFGAFSLCYTAAPVITTPSWQHFAVATAVAVPLAMVIFAVLVLMGRRQRRRSGE